MTVSMVRHVITTGALAAVVLCGAARAASAQSFISPFIGYNFGGSSGCPDIDNCENKTRNLGVAFGSIGRFAGAEAEFSFIDNFFGESPGASSHVITFMGNFMLAPKFGVFQPYGVIGLGWIKTHAEVSLGGLLESDNNHFGVRGDVRYFHAFSDLEILGIPIADTKLDFGRLSGAAVFKF
jgi:hypothetical protein